MEEIKAIFNNLSEEERKEVLAKIAQAADSDAIIAAAKAKNIELSKETADAIYNKFNEDENVSDDALADISGGSSCNPSECP